MIARPGRRVARYQGRGGFTATIASEAESIQYHQVSFITATCSEAIYDMRTGMYVGLCALKSWSWLRMGTSNLELHRNVFRADVGREQSCT